MSGVIEMLDEDRISLRAFYKVEKAELGKTRPSFAATDLRTFWSPRETKTSVTSLPIDLRAEIAKRCC